MHFSAYPLCGNKSFKQRIDRRKKNFVDQLAGAASHNAPRFHRGIPTTSFTCVDPITEDKKVPGFYADPEASCQVKFKFVVSKNLTLSIGDFFHRTSYFAAKFCLTCLILVI